MTKQIFTQSQQPEEEEILPKQEFYNVETTIDNEPCLLYTSQDKRQFGIHC